MVFCRLELKYHRIGVLLTKIKIPVRERRVARQPAWSASTNYDIITTQERCGRSNFTPRQGSSLPNHTSGIELFEVRFHLIEDRLDSSKYGSVSSKTSNGAISKVTWWLLSTLHIDEQFVG